MEFRALHTTSLTEEIAVNLENLLSDLPGIKQFVIAVDSQEFRIVFDERQLGFRALVGEMAKAGCPLRSINAALLFADSAPKLDGGRTS